MRYDTFPPERQPETKHPDISTDCGESLDNTKNAPVLFSNALQMQTCAAQLGASIISEMAAANAILVDNVPRTCACGPPSDGPGIHQLRLQKAAAAAANGDENESCDVLVSPWGAKAVAQNFKGEPETKTWRWMCILARAARPTES